MSLKSAFLLSLSLVFVVNTKTSAHFLHPQDGPHADLRITISDEAVSVFINMNVVFADELVDVPREHFDLVHTEEGPTLRDALVEYFADANDMFIDNVEVSPTLGGFALTEPNEQLLPMFPISGMRGLQRAELKLVYPAKSTPQVVEMRWGPYPKDILLSTNDNPRNLEMAAELTAFGLMSNITFSEENPEYVWHNTGITPEERFLKVPELAPPKMWRVPVVSGVLLVLAAITSFSFLVTPRLRRRWGTGVVSLIALGVGALLTWDVAAVRMHNPFEKTNRITEQQALSIFEPLHANIYRAFDYASESDVYDALARSVDGELLDTLYNQIYRSLIMQEAGDAVSRVQQVTPIDSEVIELEDNEDNVSFDVRARWQVKGSVSHWGHSHTRVNEYEAHYTVTQTTNGWRIAANEILEQRRLDPEKATLPPLGTEL